MRTIIKLFATVMVLFSITSCVTEPKTEPVKKTDISEFLGQWTIDIQGGSVGWLEVRQGTNYLDGDVLWGGGSVLPVSNIFLARGQVLVVQRSNNVVRSKDTSNVRTQESDPLAAVPARGHRGHRAFGLQRPNRRWAR